MERMRPVSASSALQAWQPADGNPRRRQPLVASIADLATFKSGRNLAAWIGLVPKQNSSGGKERLGGISKQGNRYLHQLLVAGALSVTRHAERHSSKRARLITLIGWRTTWVAAVALAAIRRAGADLRRRMR